MEFGIVKSVIQNGQDLPTRPINIIFTSSRDAPLRVRRFLNELVRVIPYSLKINRGRQNLHQILSKAIRYNAKYVGIFRIVKGNPAGLKVIDLVTSTVKYEFNIKGVTLYSEKVKNGKKVYVDEICIKVESYGNCNDIIEMLIDIGAKGFGDCKYYALITSYDNNICELKFIDKNYTLVGPIIRFLV
ncbi:MAG: hypothetical protein QXV69_01075 [Sulfolobaceae archaeon]